MAQEFEQPQVEQPQDAGTLRAQRMTAAESRAVIDLWQQERTEQTGLTDRPAVPDVAEGLDITVEDVQRLLQDVRAKRIAEERALATAQELSEIRLAEEERNLAEIRRQRAEQERQLAELERQVSQGLWGVEDDRRQEAPPRLRRGKPRQAAPVEWTGLEDFWDKTEEDREAGRFLRAERNRKNALYAMGAALLFPVLISLLTLAFTVLWPGSK